MTEERIHEFVHNVTLDSGDKGREYRNGRGKTITVGDMIRVDRKSAQYKVMDVFVENTEVYVTCYGGPKGRLLTRTFHVDRCSRVLKGQDANEEFRSAAADMSDAVKSNRKGWR